MDEYGHIDHKDVTTSAQAPREDPTASKSDRVVSETAPLMQEEERATGAISWAIYAKYFRYAGSVLWAPTIITLLLLSQGAAGELNS